MQYYWAPKKSRRRTPFRLTNLLHNFQGVLVRDKALVPLRVEAAKDRDWGRPGAIFDIGEGNSEVGQRKTKCNFELVENWKYGSWESSCLVKFSEFLGFPTKGFEEENLNLLGKLVASQKRC